MRVPLIVSAALHVGLFALTLIGLPYAAPDPVVVANAVNVEIVDIDEITQTDRLPAPGKATEEPKSGEPESQKPAPAQSEEAPPDLLSPEPPDVETAEAEPESEPEPVPVPEPEDIAEPPDEIPDRPAPSVTPKRKPKPPEKKLAQAQDKDFQSLLRNLAPDAGQSAQEPQTPEQTAGGGIENALLSDRLTISELDAFKQQIEPCWNVPMGSKYAENLVVEIKVIMNPDGTVQNARFMDRGRYTRDPTYRAAADSAMRALRNPRCSPLRLPVTKYAQWRTITIRFDPRDML